jgi:hypothetical protein
LKEAYRRARDAARIAAIPAAVKEARIADLRAAREQATFMSSWQQAEARNSEIDRELSALMAA